MLDTSVIVAYYNKIDKHHERARKIFEGLIDGKYGEIFINEQVFGECATIFLLKFNDISKVNLLLDSILEAVYLIYSDEDTFNKTFKIFKSQKKSTLSFADCSLIACAKQSKINSIATFDEDFKKVEGIEIIN